MWRLQILQEYGFYVKWKLQWWGSNLIELPHRRASKHGPKCFNNIWSGGDGSESNYFKCRFIIFFIISCSSTKQELLFVHKAAWHKLYHVTKLGYLEQLLYNRLSARRFNAVGKWNCFLHAPPRFPPAFLCTISSLFFSEILGKVVVKPWDGCCMGGWGFKFPQLHDSNIPWPCLYSRHFFPLAHIFEQPWDWGEGEMAIAGRLWQGNC